MTPLPPVERPWHREYPETVPTTLEPYPAKTLVDVVRETAELRPEHMAFWFKDAQISYQRFYDLASAFGRWLTEDGAQRAERVALVLPNSPQAVIAQFGAWLAGLVVVPINPLYTETELENALVETGAETVVVLTPFYAKVRAIQPRTGVVRVVASNIKEFLPPVSKSVFTFLKEARDGHRISLEGDDTWFFDAIEAGRRMTTPLEPPTPEDNALLLFTGGTTGSPKAAAGTHGSILRSAMQAHAWFRPILEEWDDVVVLAMPMFHVYGNVGILATSLVGHHPLALVPNPRDLGDVLRTVTRTKAAFLPGVPTFFVGLLDQPRVVSGKTDLSTLKLCISGSAPLLTETRRRFETLTRSRIVDAYSITEAMNAAVIGPVDREPRPGTIGLPLPDVEVRIVDIDTLEDLPPGSDGSVLIRAPQLMEGYWGRPGESAEMIVDGWLHTGDVGRVDDDGYVTIAGRTKEMIKSGGLAVWPGEVEDAIAAHPAVSDVAVAGIEDPYRGESVKAWVVPIPGSSLNADDLREWVRPRLAAYKVPREYEFREKLPKSHLGKTLRRSLGSGPDEPHLSTVDVGGVAYSVEEQGEGPAAIIFSHGVMMDKRIFEPQLSALHDRYRCVAFDFRGHGRTEVTVSGYDVDTLTEDAAAVIEQLGCAPCHFIGHSLGSFVGLRLAIRYPHLIRSLVLLAPSADRQPKADVLRYRMLQKVAGRLGIAPLSGSLMKTMFGRSFLDDRNRAAERLEWRSRIGSQSLEGMLKAVDGVLSRPAIGDELPRIGVPTLVIFGSEDVAAPRAAAERVAKGIPTARFVELTGAGHLATVERPDEVTRLISEFLAADTDAVRT